MPLEPSQRYERMTHEMRIKHSLVNYIVPAFFVLILCAGGAGDTSDAGRAMVYMGIGIVVLCLIDHLTSYIEVKNGLIKAHVGLIRRQNLSTPIGNINGCEVRKFLIWNRLKITSGLTVYVFKNMKNIDGFTQAMAKQNISK